MRGFSEDFCSAIKRRGLNITSLASMIFTGRAHLGLVLNGRREGSRTWTRLRKVLSEEEYRLAWDHAQSGRGTSGTDENAAERLKSLA